MADLKLGDIRHGATVYSADGHALGNVTDIYTDEFEVDAGKRDARTFRLADVRAATPDRIDLTLKRHDIEQGPWNVETLKDAKGYDRHVTQVGVRPVFIVPEYDEEQTTTGGPPTDEADV